MSVCLTASLPRSSCTYQPTSSCHRPTKSPSQPQAVAALANTLDTAAGHARAVNADAALRRALSAAQAADRVQEDRALSDPPLLRLEAEAAQAYLSLLLHIAAGGSAGAGAGAGAGQAGARREAARRAVQARRVHNTHRATAGLGQGGRW